jgi:hypothetical protein
MFSYCWSLQYVPNLILNTTSNISAQYMFERCLSLKYIGQLNVTKITSTSGLFNRCYNLQKSELINTRISIDYSNCSLSRNELINIFTALSTITSQYITITGNPGTAELTVADRFIATSKGWTIIG